MGFRTYKEYSAYLVIVGLALAMLFGLFGCGNRKQKTYEEIAQAYLEKTYHKEFVVEELSKKGVGPFLTDEYSGFAYERDDPLKRFKVWVTNDKKTVNDTYYSVQLLPSIDEWIQEEADQVWGQTKAAVILDMLRYNPAASYEPDDYRSFFENESVECTVYLFICENSISLEQYSEFDAVMKETIIGSVQIYCTNEDEFAALDVSNYINATPNYSIRIGSSQSVIEEIINQKR